MSNEKSIEQIIQLNIKEFRKSHIDYLQSKYIIREIRKELGLKETKRRSQGTIKRLSNEELTDFLNTAHKQSPEIGLMMDTLYGSALRVSEFSSLQPEDLMIDELKILVRSGKGDKRREVPITAALMNTLRLHLRDRKIGFLFENRRSTRFSSRSLQLLVKRIGQEAEISMNVTPHILRHTRATVLAEMGMPKDLIQAFLGHESPNTTEIYTHTANLPLNKRFRELIERK